MNRMFSAACVFGCACFAPLPIHAASCIWDNHLGSGAIAAQAQLVGQILAAHTPPEPIILGADFNVTPQSDELSPIRAVLGSVFEGFEEQPIDSFFVSADTGVVCAQVVPDPGEASDHDPVTCLLKIPFPP